MEPDGGGVEQGEGDEEHGEDEDRGLGRGVELRDNGLLPADGGVEQGGGEGEPEEGMDMGFGRAIWMSMGVGEEGVGVGEGVEEDRGVCCFGDDDVDREAVVQIGATGGMATRAAGGPHCAVFGAVQTEAVCAAVA